MSGGADRVTGLPDTESASSPISSGTATSANTMGPNELGRFLDERREGRLGTVRRDGDVHLTPIWCLRDGDALLFCLEQNRLHLRNLRRRPRATILVDEDARLTAGWQAGARAAMLSGPVELVTQAAKVERVRERLIDRYYGDATADPEFIATRGPALTYVLGRLTPARVLSWDFTKG